MPFVSITRLRVRRWRYVPQFLIQSIRAARQAKRSAGSISVSVLRDIDRAFWTRTVWRDEAAMRAFMRSGVHRRIMARLPEWCDEAALVRWVQEASDPPSWQDAHRRLQKEGRRSRVSQPSAAQLRLRDPRATQRLTPLALSVRQGVVASRLSAGRPAARPVEPVFLSSQGSSDAAPTPADRGWEVCKTVGTASAELPRADVHPAAP